MAEGYAGAMIRGATNRSGYEAEIQNLMSKGASREVAENIVGPPPPGESSGGRQLPAPGPITGVPGNPTIGLRPDAGVLDKAITYLQELIAGPLEDRTREGTPGNINVTRTLQEIEEDKRRDRERNIGR